MPTETLKQRSLSRVAQHGRHRHRVRCAGRRGAFTVPENVPLPALMRRMHAELQIRFLIVTHDPRLAARCDRVIERVDGRVVRDQASP